MNPQAAELNAVLQAESPAAFKLLSTRGRGIFFPRKGLVAQGLEAKGKTINASIGEAREDDGSPLRLGPVAECITIDPADAFSYAPSFGKPELRDAWARLIRRKNPGLGDKLISRPVVTNALTHGLSTAGYLFVDEGDEIILPEPYWGNYRLIFAEACGAVLKTFPAFTSEAPNAPFNVEGLTRALSSPGPKGPNGPKSDKKILLLNFPNNPTGYTPAVAEAEAVVNAVRRAAEAGKTILILLDDAYFGLVYRRGIAGESPFAALADLHENVVACKIDGATKEDYVWGFRVGFITFAGRSLGAEALAALEDKAAGRVRGSISNSCHLSQSLLLAAYTHPDYTPEKSRAYDLLKERHDALAAELEAHPEYAERFTPLPFNSGYFMCVRIARGDAEAVRQRLLSAYDTGVIALGSLVRIAYSSLPKSQIPVLLSNLYAACAEV